MAQQRLTDRTALAETPNDSDLLHIVDVSDTTDNASGTSKKITVSDLLSAVDNGGNGTPTNGGTFTGALDLSNLAGTYYSTYNLGTSGTITFSNGGSETNFGYDYLYLVADGVTALCGEANADAIFYSQIGLPEDRILEAGNYDVFFLYTPNGTILSITEATQASSGGETEIDYISGLIEVPDNKDYKLVVKMPFDGTITETTTISTAGTCTATFKINTTELGGTANSVSSSEQSQAHASSNTFVAGDDIVLTITSNSSCANMSFTVKYTK